MELEEVRTDKFTMKVKGGELPPDSAAIVISDTMYTEQSTIETLKDSLDEDYPIVYICCQDGYGVCCKFDFYKARTIIEFIRNHLKRNIIYIVTSTGEDGRAGAMIKFLGEYFDSVEGDFHKINHYYYKVLKEESALRFF